MKNHQKLNQNHASLSERAFNGKEKIPTKINKSAKEFSCPKQHTI